MLELGRYTRRNWDLDFDKYTAQLFDINPPGLRRHCIDSCGEHAVWTLTHKGFSEEERQRYGWVLTRNQMVRLLRKRGLTVIPLSVCDVTNRRFAFDNPIKHRHVVLICQLMHRGEASWGILYGNKYCHNNFWEEPQVLEFVNRPIIAAYLVWHKTWTMDQTLDRLRIRRKKQKSKTKTKVKVGAFKMSQANSNYSQSYSSCSSDTSDFATIKTYSSAPTINSVYRITPT